LVLSLFDRADCGGDHNTRLDVWMPDSDTNYLAGVFRSIFFPQAMVLLIALAALPASWLLWRHNPASAIPLSLLSVFSCLLAFRLLLAMAPLGLRDLL
jgi:hypothetical protein